MLSRLKKFLATTLLVLTTLVLTDLALHAAAKLSSRVDEVTRVFEAKIPDARLGYRPNPAYPGHDARGFRNAVLPERADIVALGDSQTYGSGVASVDAWPRVLGENSGQTVYSMALGGYGPAHSLLLWDEASALRPRIVIDGLYAGNDLYDAFSLVYKRNKARELRNPEQARIDEIEAAERVEPLHVRVGRIYRRGRVRSAGSHAARQWLESNSRIIGTLKRLQYELSQWRDKSRAEPTPEQRWEKAQNFAQRYPDYLQPLSSAQARTLFTSEYRLTALNLDDPRIREGQRIVLESIRRMQEMAKRDGIRFIVLLIPTKELVFQPWAESVDAVAYRELIRNELRFWEETRAFLEARSIAYIDGLQPLRRQVEQGPQPYWVSHNGHPNEIGQRSLADAVQAFLESR